ncbi:MAG: ComEC/Rec2 family competence protein [Deltaproteobacteria bacterium]|nr:ComEC/Rec2 family competence protein [Deltaproteobacteria bacterium]
MRFRKFICNCFRATCRFANNDSVEIVMLLALIMLSQLRVIVGREVSFLLICGLGMLCFCFAALSLRQGFSVTSINKCLCRLLFCAALAAAVSLLAINVLPTEAAILKLRAIAIDQDSHFSRSRSSLLKGKVVGSLERARVGELRVTVYSEEIGGKVLLTSSDLPWSPLADLIAGDKIAVRAKLSPVVTQGESRPPIFSYRGFLYRRGIVAQGAVERVVATSKIEDSARKRLVTKLIERLIAEMGPSDSLDVLLALTVGERAVVAYEVEQLFRDTGTSHILVVSGFHVGMIYMLIFVCIKWLVGRIPVLLLFMRAELLAAVVGYFATWFYALVVGLSPTVVRSMSAISLVVLGLALGRSRQAIRSLLVAFLVVAFVWPAAFLDVGCQLTFFAIFGLLWSSDICDRIKAKCLSVKGSKLSLFLIANCVTCFCAWYCTAPIVLLWFNSIVPMGPLINVIAVPMFSVAIIVGIVAIVAFGLALPFSDLLIRIVLRLVDYLLVMLAELDSVAKSARVGVIALAPATSQVIAVLFVLGFLLYVTIVSIAAKNESEHSVWPY